MGKPLTRRHRSLDLMIASVVALRGNDTELAETRMSEAITDPDLDEALEELDNANTDDEPDAAEETPDEELDTETAALTQSVTVDLVIDEIMRLCKQRGHSFASGEGSAAYIADLRKMLAMGFDEPDNTIAVAALDMRGVPDLNPPEGFKMVNNLRVSGQINDVYAPKGAASDVADVLAYYKALGYKTSNNSPFDDEQSVTLYGKPGGPTVKVVRERIKGTDEYSDDVRTVTHVPARSSLASLDDAADTTPVDTAPTAEAAGTSTETGDPESTIDTPPTAEEASLMERVNDRVKRNLASL